MATTKERNVLLVGDFITDRTWFVGGPSLHERYNSHYSVHPHTLVEPGRETDVAGGIATVARAIGAVEQSKLIVMGAWSYYAKTEFELDRLVPLEGHLKKDSIEFRRIRELEFTSMKTRVYLPEPGGATLKYRFDRNSEATEESAREPNTQWPDAETVDLVILGDYGYGVLNLPEVKDRLKAYSGKKEPTIILRSSSRRAVMELDWDLLMLNLHHLANFLNPDHPEPFDTPVTKQVGDGCTYHPSLIAALKEVTTLLKDNKSPRAVLLNLESEGALLLHNDHIIPFLLAAPHHDGITGVGANDVLLAHFGVEMMRTRDEKAFGDRLRHSCYRAVRASAAFISSALQLELKDQNDKLWYAPKVEVTDLKIERATPILARVDVALNDLQNGVTHARQPLQQEKKYIKLHDAGWYLEGFHTVNPTFGKDIVRLKNRIKEYVTAGTPHRPFFAVLCGEPGAGKSSLAEALGKYSECEVITANAAQWTSADDLFNLCERIRDVRMANKRPLVFIDEVDSPTHNSDLFAKLLSPVWDGTYTADGLIRPLGTPTVFLVAGSGVEWHRGEELFMAADSPKGNHPPKLGDLVSRLSIRPLDIKPLSERKEDIVYIVAHQILKRFPRVSEAAEGIFELFSDSKCKYGARSIASVMSAFGPPRKERFLDTTDLHGVSDIFSMHLKDIPEKWQNARNPVQIMP